MLPPHVRAACKPRRRRHATALAAATAALVAFPAIAQADTAIQGEALSLNPVSAGEVLDETAAIGGKTMRVWSNASMQRSVDIGEPSIRLVLRARGTSCKGAPKLSVSVDGVTRMQSDISSSSYADYSTSLTLTKGPHMVEVAYANDFRNRRCDRSVYVDAVTFIADAQAAPTPPPPPADTTAPPADTTMQGEALTLNPVSAGGPFDDPDAVGNATMGIWSSASAEGSVNVTDASNRLVIRARGENCDGAPRLDVLVDGGPVAQPSISSAGYGTYAADVSVAKGTHNIKLTYSNDNYQPGVCDRNVFVDEVKFVAGTASAPESAPAPTPAPATPERQTSWRAPMSAPLADADAASLVTPARETRFTNQDENSYRPSGAELDAYRHGERDKYGRTAAEYNPLAYHVTGGFSGTTDEIIQWAAHKWGIPEDILRAQAVTESYWNMSGLGDRTTVSNPLNYPSLSRIAGTSDVYQSLGIMQVRWSGPDGANAGTGTEPLRWKSTAFNIDHYASTVRYYYDGRCDWCNGTYAAGQEWLSVGGWFNPYPWGNEAQNGYIAKVQDHLNNRTWAQPGFSE